MHYHGTVRNATPRTSPGPQSQYDEPALPPPFRRHQSSFFRYRCDERHHALHLIRLVNTEDTPSQENNVYVRQPVVMCFQRDKQGKVEYTMEYNRLIPLWPRGVGWQVEEQREATPTEVSMQAQPCRPPCLGRDGSGARSTFGKMEGGEIRRTLIIPGVDVATTTTSLEVLSGTASRRWFIPTVRKSSTHII